VAIGRLPARWWSPRSWSRGDRLAIGVLVAIPTVLFVLPAALGHPAIVGDNLIQNYPLRVLTGQQIRSGHWPLWNPYSDSGTPLLGGMNAGAAYPGTLLFVVGPPLFAWVLNLLAVYWCAGIGLYVLARWLGARPLGAAVGAAAYAFSGAMIGQQIHIAVIQGQAWLPWLVLSQLCLGRALLGSHAGERAYAVARRSAPGLLGLAACVGLICLTGEPRSIADAEIVVPVVALCALVAHGGVRRATVLGRVAYVLATALGTAWGVALALVQLLPGWGFVTLSERSEISYSFFGAGSMGWRWLSLLVSQGLLGDNGILGTPRFFGSYNLPEVTGYVGLLAITAVVAFAAQCVGRSSAPRRLLVTFLVLFVVGVVLTMGNTTPLGPVLHEIPVFGRTRLQSRNLAIVDLGATVLLTWWLDAVLGRRPAEASLLGARRYVVIAPAALTAALCAVALASPGFVTQVLLASPGTAAIAQGIRVTVAVSLCLAVACVAALLAGRRRLAALGRWLVVIAIVDLVGFNVFYETGLVTGLRSPYPDRALARSSLGAAGRTALVDPSIAAYHVTAPIGLGNLNVFTQLPSVQGYGSLISARYNAVTGTRLLGTLDGCALARGEFVPLRLATMAVATNGLAESEPTSTATSSTSCGPPAVQTFARRYFGQVAAVGRLAFVASLATTRVRPHAVLYDVHGRVLHVPVVYRGGTVGATGPITATFPTHPVAAYVDLLDPRGFQLYSTVLTTASGTSWWLNTPMQLGLEGGGWRLVRVDGELSFFRTREVAPTVWLAPPRPGSSVRVVARSIAGTLSVAVHASAPVTLVRSEAWLPGWVATITRPGAPRRVVAVAPAGLIQSVALPAGTSTVQFSYHAPHLRAGIVATSVSLAALLAGGAWLALTRRRSRPAA